jgi:hypothetical protein
LRVGRKYQDQDVGHLDRANATAVRQTGPAVYQYDVIGVPPLGSEFLKEVRAFALSKK